MMNNKKILVPSAFISLQHRIGVSYFQFKSILIFQALANIDSAGLLFKEMPGQRLKIQDALFRRYWMLRRIQNEKRTAE